MIPIEQRLQYARQQLAYIKSETHNALNPQSLNARLKDIIEFLEYFILGELSDGNPNNVPGTPAQFLDDPTKTRVEFTSGPGAVAQRNAENEARARAGAFSPHVPYGTPQPNYGPAQGYGAPQSPPGRPINTGDITFIPGPPAGQPGTVGGQTVEYIRQDGVHVDSQGNPIGQQRPPLPPNYPKFAQGPGSPARVEILGGTHSAPPATSGTPITNETAQIVAHIPTRPTEAGSTVAPVAGGPYAMIIPPPPPAAPPPPNGTAPPQTLEELRNALPIPLAE
jgi:hypothetical protein